MLFKEDENQCSVLHKQVLVNIPNILLKLCMPVKLHFSPLIQEHKWNGSMALNNSVLVTWRQHLAEGGLLQTCSVGSKILLLFHWQNWFIFSYQMDLGKMDEFCNGDGMPYFMSVSLPFCMLLFLGFSRILKKGTLSLKKKSLFLRVCLGFCREHFSQLAFRLQDIQIREKLTSKIPLKANTRFITSTTSFLSES